MEEVQTIEKPKVYPKKPTKKQRQAVKEVMLGDSRTAGQVLRDAGYGKGTQIQPSRVFKSEGFQMALEEAGLTDEFLNTALADDIKAKKKNRLGELTLAYRLKKKLDNEKGESFTQYNFFLNESQLKRIAGRVQNGDSASSEESDRFSDSNES